MLGYVQLRIKDYGASRRIKREKRSAKLSPIDVFETNYPGREELPVVLGKLVIRD